MDNEFLPIGTVVELDNVPKSLMIIGYSCMSYSDDKIYDYNACFYPSGTFSDQKTIAFNHENIKKVLHMGLKNSDYERLIKSSEFLKKKIQNRFKKVETFAYKNTNSNKE